MADLSGKFDGAPPSTATLAFTEHQVALCLNEVDEVVIGDTDGRHAISLPEQRVRDVYARIEANHPELIVHEFRELDEKLGVLVIAHYRSINLGLTQRISK